MKGVSKARTKMAAAQREMSSPPMKYITTLNMVIWNFYIDWQVHFDELTSCGKDKTESPNMLRISMWMR